MESKKFQSIQRILFPLVPEGFPSVILGTMTDLWEKEVLRQIVEFSCSHNTSSGKSSTLNHRVTAEDGAICPCYFLAHDTPKYLLEGYVKKGKIVLRVSQVFKNAS